MASELESRVSESDLLSPGPLRSLERIWQVLRYYRKRQLIARAWKLTFGKLLASRSIPHVSSVRLREEALPGLAVLIERRPVRWEDDPSSLVQDLKAGTFTLLGERRELGMPVDWPGGQHPNAERLWQFQLHYQEYLLDAVATRQPEAWSVIENLMTQWLVSHGTAFTDHSSDSWHPYCLSRRTPVWLQLLASGEFHVDLQERMLSSLAAQAEHLCRNLEYDLGGNHLLENAHALALAGSTIVATVDGRSDRQQKWLTTAERIFRQELPQQILPHGEHFERSPMYHVQLLGNLLQISIVSQNISPRLAQACRDWARPLWIFLESLLHPDGEIPLFGDSCFGETYPVVQIRLLMAAAYLKESPIVPSERKSLSNSSKTTASPYWIWRSKEDAWIVDGGAAAADTLPAHGHCDLGGFEASIGGARWFVDAGLYGYYDDVMRRYCRSSLAHNVVTVDDKNQFDIWSRFRMGYRASIESFESHQEESTSWARSVHWAYRRLGVGKVHRITAVHDNSIWLCIDHVERVSGRCIRGTLRLAPGVKAESVSQNTWRIADSRNSRLLKFFGVSNSSLNESWYAPRFGQRIPVDTLLYEATSNTEVSMGWLLCHPDSERDFSLDFQREDGKWVAKLLSDVDTELFKWIVADNCVGQRRLKESPGKSPS